MTLKNPMTPAGIESATFRFVAQQLNHCATAVMLSSACTDSLEANSGEGFLHLTFFPINYLHPLPYHWKLHSCWFSAAQQPSSGVGSLPVDVTRPHTL